MYYGRFFTWAWIILLGHLAIDEILCNFLKKLRSIPSYILIQLSSLALCFSFPFWQRIELLYDMTLVLALSINLFLIIYLFIFKIENYTWVDKVKKYPVLVIPFTLLPLLSLGSVVYYQQWHFYFSLLILITFGMDSGAWLVGKIWGRKKLWPKVSPNKTLEGFFGGCLVSIFFSGFFWYTMSGAIRLSQVFFLALFGILSQMGDLVQSKIKRQYNVKDSSQLIPGHGGIYDRLDSIMFLAPFFIVSIRYL